MAFLKKTPTRPPELDTLLRDVERCDVRSISLRERCRMAKHLQNYVMEAALKHKLHTVVNGQPGTIHEKAFTREITQMKRILETLEFSPALHRLLTERTLAVADAFTEKHPRSALQRSWDQADRNTRLADMKNFLTTQCALFGGAGSVDFIPSPVDLKPLPWAIRGHFNVAGNDLAQRIIPPVVINETELDKGTALNSYQTLFHEQVHAMLWQLGVAAHYQTIPENHPLYADAILMRERAKYGLNISPAVPSVYHADPEEKACISYEKLFIDRCIDGAPGARNGLQKLWGRFFSPSCTA